MISEITKQEVYKTLKEWAKHNNLPEGKIQQLLANLVRSNCAKSFSEDMLAVLALFRQDGQRPERKPMSKAAKRRRIREGGDSPCPYCGNEETDEFDYGETEPEKGGTFIQKVGCPNCGRRWEDEYRLIDVHELA